MSRVTGVEPISPAAGHPPMSAENIPAPPPARAILMPSGRNFASVFLRTEDGSPSAMPPAPMTKSCPWSCRFSCSVSFSCDFDQPASWNTRACSGDTTRNASHAPTSLGCPTLRRQAAKLLASDSGARLFWSMMPCTPSAANKVTVDCAGSCPCSTLSPSQWGSSASAKQNVYLPGCPSADRSIWPGRPETRRNWSPAGQPARA